MFMNDRTTGQFIWAMPFPYDAPNFLISKIDVATGKTYINTDLILKEPGDRKTICFFNTKSYWAMSYHPGMNALFVPYIDNCLDNSRAAPASFST